MANTISESWQKLAGHHPVHGEDHAKASGETNWVEVSGSGSYGWLDPRLNGEVLQQSGDSNGPDWSIPVVSTSTGIAEVSGRMRLIPVQ